MSWFSTVPIVAACLALLFLPGSLILCALGLRRPAFIAVAPILTISLAAVIAISAPYFGLAWSALPVVVGAVLAAAVLFGIRKLVERRRPRTQNGRPTFPKPSWVHVIAAVGFVIGAGSIALQLHQALGRPDSISQTFDNVFHLNAVRFVLESGNASSLSLTGMTSGDNPPYFYPAAWHGLASLLIQITGAPLAVAVNVLNLCIAATVWTLGCMFLVRSIMGPNPYAVGAAGILAAGFGSFPLLLLDFGVLYPNFLSVSMIPAALACVSIFFGNSKLSDLGPVARYSLAPLAAIGVAIAHPNGVMSLIALSVPLLLSAFVTFCIAQRRNGNTPRLRLLAGVALLAILAIMAILWKLVRPPAAAATWLPVQTPGQAVGEVLTNSAMLRPPAWAVSMLVFAGLVYVLRRRRPIWLLGSFLIVAGLFVVVSAGPAGWLRDLLTGVWYNDSYRLAALLPVTAVALAAIGAAWGQQAMQRRLRAAVAARALPELLKKPAVASVILPMILFATIAVAQAAPMITPVRSAQANYSTNPDSPLVSSDELAVIDELDDLVPVHATIAVNPWTGGAMAFALADRNTTSKHTLTTYTKAIELLNDKLREASTDPDVCAAARANNVGYVLDFGTREVHGGNHGFVGLQIPDATPGFQLLAQRGEAKLFKLTACS
jgi:hypothetical protein